MELIRSKTLFQGKWKNRWNLAFWLPAYGLVTLYLLALAFKPLYRSKVFLPCLTLFPLIAAALSLVVVIRAPNKIAAKIEAGIGSVLGVCLETSVVMFCIYFCEILRIGDV